MILVTCKGTAYAHERETAQVMCKRLLNRIFDTHIHTNEKPYGVMCARSVFGSGHEKLRIHTKEKPV